MDRRERGVWGERCAAAALVRKGMRIVAQNWRFGRCEIDVVAVDGAWTVFVEVKVRAAAGPEPCWASVDVRKQARWLRAGEAYLRQHPGVPAAARFDFIWISGVPQTFEVRHYRDVLGPAPTPFSPAIFTPQ
jgi:putative endonuclease